MKVNWLRGVAALLAVVIGLAFGYLMDVPREEAETIPASLEARYRFNKFIMDIRQRLQGSKAS